MARKFPYLNEDERFEFPPVDQATEEGIVGVGGNLSPGMLLSAYSQGAFPWFSPGEPILWWCPEPRFVLFPGELHVSRSMAKTLRNHGFSITFDRQFADIIRGCSRTPRPGQLGTWITSDMIDAYTRLHELGYAHSVEVREGENIVGGLYGVMLGSCFFGESMFAWKTNASKIGFIELVRALSEHGLLTLIDCQVHTHHLESLGARNVSRKEFLSLLNTALTAPTPKGSLERVLADGLG